MTKPNKDMFERVKDSRTFSNLLTAFDLKNKAVLDIGSSEGHYLNNFGPGSIGITIIPEHVEEARKRGLKVVLGNIEDPNFRMEEKFDVIWANNLFEHMNSPHVFLMKIKEFLKPDGLLILGVPVIPTMSWLTRFKKFRGSYAVSHVNFFTRKTLVETVRFAGWQVKEARLFYMKKSFLDFPFNFIAPHIYVIASPNTNFSYAHKRELSLAGYK